MKGNNRRCGTAGAKEGCLMKRGVGQTDPSGRREIPKELPPRTSRLSAAASGGFR